MSVSLKNYTLKYLAVALLVIIAVWATLFYAFIREELYDNTDDGLKNLKIQIIREAYINPDILQIKEFDFNQFRIRQISEEEYKNGNFFRNENFYMEYDDDYEPYRVLETCFRDSENKPQKLEIRTSTVEEDEFRENLFVALVFLYAFLVISIIVINTIVLKKVWEPFYKTLSNLGNYQFGKSKIKEDKPIKIREFKLLNSEINKMIERNEQTFEQQKQFIENASHELQTPLAIAINKLEMLIEDENISEENLTELSKTKEGLLRLVKLNKSLLMLTRIENNQFSNKEHVNLNDIVKTVIDDFSEMIAFKNILLNLSENGVFQTQINPELAYILISNLFRNAIKYNPSDGKIEVEIYKNQLLIKNTSTGNEPLDKNKIFNRFYKQSQNYTSTGLGLSIVKTIADNHSDLGIGYSFENNFHIFSVKTNNS
ncbi:MAG TPA: HAMP domain-containing sensor histidine kinase [Aquaticitalea sp.]|nr:HAMP domain-containing sensor histidine kinase [Aquaticitalea sp.]HNU58502.1 HAMP domain-containing sensor histidine kinase [Aquaticitalea sp.]